VAGEGCLLHARKARPIVLTDLLALNGTREVGFALVAVAVEEREGACVGYTEQRILVLLV
jgi:hypothetical protein